MTSAKEIKQELRQQWIETPSWAYGNTGTRFKVFRNPGAARDPYEKIADAAQVHRLTGVAPSVALHIPWDRVDDYSKLAEHAAELGIVSAPSTPTCSRTTSTASAASATPIPRCAGRRPTICSSAWTSCGAVGSPIGKPVVRRRHQLPGPGRYQGAGRTAWRRRCGEIYAGLPEGSGCCSSTSCSSRRSTPPTCPTGAPACCTAWPSARKAKVVVDTGHHAPGTNIEFIVAGCCCGPAVSAGSTSTAASTPTTTCMVGAADPYQLFRILHEGSVAVGAHRPGAGVAFMLDQCHNIEDKVPAEIRSVMNVQEATAKALLVDREALKAAQQEGDVMAANGVLVDAFSTDVRPLLAELREEMGIDPDPIAAYSRSGHAARARAERAAGGGSSWGG